MFDGMPAAVITLDDVRAVVRYLTFRARLAEGRTTTGVHRGVPYVDVRVPVWARGEVYAEIERRRIIGTVYVVRALSFWDHIFLWRVTVKKNSDHLGQHNMTAAEWNTKYPEGTHVTLVLDDGSKLATKTRSIAWELGHGQPVVKVEGKTGGWLLSRVAPSQVLWQQEGELLLMDDGGTPVLRIALSAAEYKLLHSHQGEAIRLTIEKIDAGPEVSAG